MTSGQSPESRDQREPVDPEGSKRKLAITLAVLALILTILIVVIFGWWQREGEDTDEDAFTLWTLVYEPNATAGYERAA
jgi:hypothetical protein